MEEEEENDALQPGERRIEQNVLFWQKIRKIFLRNTLKRNSVPDTNDALLVNRTPYILFS